jgi:hypothetical protein
MTILSERRVLAVIFVLGVGLFPFFISEVTATKKFDPGIRDPRNRLSYCQHIKSQRIQYYLRAKQLSDEMRPLRKNSTDYNKKRKKYRYHRKMYKYYRDVYNLECQGKPTSVMEQGRRRWKPSCWKIFKRILELGDELKKSPGNRRIREIQEELKPLNEKFHRNCKGNNKYE